MAQTHTHSRALSHDFFSHLSFALIRQIVLLWLKYGYFNARSLSLSRFLCDFFFSLFRALITAVMSDASLVSVSVSGWSVLVWHLMGGGRKSRSSFFVFCFVSRIVRRRVYWAVLQIVCFLFFRNSLLFSWETESSKGIALVCLCECVVTVLDTAERSWVCLCVC